MSRVGPITVEKAESSVKKMYEGIQSQMGTVPNFFQTMAPSPAVLKACLAFQQAASETSLSPELRSEIALVVSEYNHCNYCLSAYCFVGHHAGAKDQDLLLARKSESKDPKTKAILKFAHKVVEKRGSVTNHDIEELKAANVSDQEIVEIVLIVNLTIFTNYFNLVTDPKLDFPEVKKLNG